MSKLAATFATAGLVAAALAGCSASVSTSRAPVAPLHARPRRPPATPLDDAAERAETAADR